MVLPAASGMSALRACTGPRSRQAWDHDRIYVVCNVPNTGLQTQLTLSKDNRPTTVTTFKRRTKLLAIRALEDDTADATVPAVLSYLNLDDITRVSFLDGGFRGRFKDACSTVIPHSGFGTPTPTTIRGR